MMGRTEFSIIDSTVYVDSYCGSALPRPGKGRRGRKYRFCLTVYLVYYEVQKFRQESCYSVPSAILAFVKPLYLAFARIYKGSEGSFFI